MKVKLIGAGLFVAVAAVVAWYVFTGQGLPPAQIRGYVGGEKIGFLENEDIARILGNRYDLSIDYVRMGSLDMAVAPAGDMDFIFPSSSLAAEVYRENGGSVRRAGDVFISPIVIYSWDRVADALMEQGIVAIDAQGVYLIDMAMLAELVGQDATWADIGLPELFGAISIFSTDPLRSNSGNLMTALVATVLNGGRTVTEADVPGLIEPLKDFLDKSGYKEISSSDLFSQYLRTGMGGRPLVALYENQMIEFAVQNPREWAQIQDRVRVLYPTPTVFSNHVFIARNDDAARFLDAMEDSEILNIVWERHGFRVGSYGARSLPASMSGVPVKAEITSVIQMPDYAAMNRIMRLLGE